MDLFSNLESKQICRLGELRFKEDSRRFICESDTATTLRIKLRTETEEIRKYLYLFLQKRDFFLLREDIKFLILFKNCATFPIVLFLFSSLLPSERY